MSKGIKLYLAVIFAIVFGVSGAVSSTLACSSMGAGKHFGLVTMVDPAMGTFTITDAETSLPIHFDASAELLKTIQIDDTIITNFEKEEDRLVAKDIQVQKTNRS